MSAAQQAEMQAAIDRQELYQHPIISAGEMLDGYPEYIRLRVKSMCRPLLEGKE